MHPLLSGRGQELIYIVISSEHGERIGMDGLIVTLWAEQSQHMVFKDIFSSVSCSMKGA